MITMLSKKNDLMNASSISRYIYNIAGVPKLCTKIMLVSENALSTLIETDSEFIVLEDMLSMIMIDNGVPLQMQGNKVKPLVLDNHFYIEGDSMETNNLVS